jgi:protein-tyrosine-phosphatase
VRGYLLEKGLDVRPHVRRTLTQALIDESDLLIVMGADHQSALRRGFGLDAPLYLEACGEAAEGLPDIEEVVADYRSNATAVTAHIRHTIDRIVELAPRLAERIPLLLRQHGKG